MRSSSEAMPCTVSSVSAAPWPSGLSAVEVAARGRFADARLVAVCAGGVDRAVAGLQGPVDDGGGVLRRDLEDAEAELGDGVRISEGRWGIELIILGVLRGTPPAHTEGVR